MDAIDQTEERTAVAVVDDDPGVLRSLGRLLEIQGFEARTYSSAEALLEEIDDFVPSCIITDLAMPQLTGLELQDKLEQFCFDYPIVFVTGYGDVQSSVRAMRHGAVDFLPKPFKNSDLLDAIERALEQSRRSRGLLSIRQRFETLTYRERQVFEQVVVGRLNKQIAADLGITEKTVKVHRGRVKRKMNCRSVAQLARMAERLGVPETSDAR